MLKVGGLWVSPIEVEHALVQHDLVKHVRACLADYKRPRWIEFIPELPKTATGKIHGTS